MESNDPSGPAVSSPFLSRFWGNSWRQKLPVIIVVIVVIGVAAVLLIWPALLRISPSQIQKGNQPVTDEQKIQTLKNLSGNSSAPQQSDQGKLQTLQKLSAPQQNTPQTSDADKLKALQQLK